MSPNALVIIGLSGLLISATIALAGVIWGNYDIDSQQRVTERHFPIFDLSLDFSKIEGPAPWLGVNCVAFNASTKSVRVVAVKGRLKIDNVDFHGDAEFGESGTAIGGTHGEPIQYGRYFSCGVRFPLSQTEADRIKELSEYGVIPVNGYQVVLQVDNGDEVKLRIPEQRYDVKTKRPVTPLARQLDMQE